MTVPVGQTPVEDVQLSEPVLHLTCGAPLPGDHWLRGYWADLNPEDGIVLCGQCHQPIYDLAQGTMRGWMETGRVAGGTPPVPEVWCVGCVATNGQCYPEMLEWWALFREGPLPVLTMTDPVERSEVRSMVYAMLGVQL